MGAKEIAQASNDLSRRTEQQAAALEETAAALDEITVNVANASKRADEARSATEDASRSARHSAQVVTQAIGAMDKIEQSSKEISNIISVIEKLMKKFPELYFEPKHESMKKENGWLFFNTELWEGEFWGEDYVFCRKAREAGVDIWVDPLIPFDHAGVKGRLLDALSNKPEEKPQEKTA